MPLFQRNINGHDVLCVRDYIKSEGPISHANIVRRYYPGDPTAKNEDSKRKNLVDVLRFLKETNQIQTKTQNSTDSYELDPKYSDFNSPKLAILHGLNHTHGEDSAYMEAFKSLVETDDRFFDKSGDLIDEMKGRREDVSWNDTRTGYWESTMEVFGLVKKISSDTSASGYISVQHDLFKKVAQKLLDPNTHTELREFLVTVNKNYFPVFTGTGQTTVAEYVTEAMVTAENRSAISIGQNSDFGQKVKINGKGMNYIELQEENDA